MELVLAAVAGDWFRIYGWIDITLLSKVKAESLLVHLILGGISGILSYYLFGFLYSLLGRVGGGEGSAAEVRTAYAWSTVPLIASTMVLVPIGLIGINPLNLGPTVALLFALSLYWSWIFLVCLAEAHRFSIFSVLLVLVMGWFINLLAQTGLGTLLYLRGQLPA